MNLGDINRPSSRINRPPGGSSSNIFGAPEAPKAMVKSTPMDQESGGRRDPITGNIVSENQKADSKTTVQQVEKATPEVAEENVEVEEEAEKVGEEEPKAEEESKQEEAVKNNEPHLGKVKNMSGLKCSQPPGGKSSIFFG